MSNTIHTPTPWFASLQPEGMFDILDGPNLNTATVLCTRFEYAERKDEMHANAAFIVRACNSHAIWAKWIVQRGPGLPDHACAECVPGGELVKAGFQCVYHEALAATETA